MPRCLNIGFIKTDKVDRCLRYAPLHDIQLNRPKLALSKWPMQTTTYRPLAKTRWRTWLDFMIIHCRTFPVVSHLVTACGRDHTETTISFPVFVESPCRLIRTTSGQVFQSRASCPLVNLTNCCVELLSQITSHWDIVKFRRTN